MKKANNYLLCRQKITSWICIRRLPLAAGDNIKRWIITPPLLLPNKLTFSGSPPNACILFLIHFKDNIISLMAWFPVHSFNPKFKKPKAKHNLKRMHLNGNGFAFIT